MIEYLFHIYIPIFITRSFQVQRKRDNPEELGKILYIMNNKVIVPGLSNGKIINFFRLDYKNVMLSTSGDIIEQLRNPQLILGL